MEEKDDLLDALTAGKPQKKKKKMGRKKKEVIPEDEGVRKKDTPEDEGARKKDTPEDEGMKRLNKFRDSDDKMGEERESPEDLHRERIEDSRKVLKNPPEPGMQYFEAPDGYIMIGPKDQPHAWYRYGGRERKGCWINPKR